jgi:hypothetical protein
VAGGLVGLERSFHGARRASNACAGLPRLQPADAGDDLPVGLVPHREGEAVRLDPTRMAQGVMTGIGFLGAGVIFKEGLSVRGLTTAASIWITAGIGASWPAPASISRWSSRRRWPCSPSPCSATSRCACRRSSSSATPCASGATP